MAPAAGGAHRSITASHGAACSGVVDPSTMKSSSARVALCVVTRAYAASRSAGLASAAGFPAAATRSASQRSARCWWIARTSSSRLAKW